jgi:putative ABC transport system ATP-binding protein
VVLNTAEKIIQKYQLTTIMITHNLGESLRFGNRLIQMNRGQIIRDLNAEEKQGLKLEDLYQWFK